MITERKILKTAKAYGLTVKGSGQQAMLNIISQMKDIARRMANNGIIKSAKDIGKYSMLAKTLVAMHNRIDPKNSYKINFRVLKDNIKEMLYAYKLGAKDPQGTHFDGSFKATCKTAISWLEIIEDKINKVQPPKNPSNW